MNLRLDLFNATGKKLPKDVQAREVSITSFGVQTASQYAPRFTGVPALHISLGKGDIMSVGELFNHIQHTKIKDMMADVQTIKVAEIAGTFEEDPFEQPNLMELLRALEVARYKVLVHTNGKTNIRPYTGLRNVVYSLQFTELGKEGGNSNVYQSLPYLRPEDSVIFQIVDEASFQAALKVLINITTKAQIVLQPTPEMAEWVFEQTFQQTIFAKLFPREPLKVHII